MNDQSASRVLEVSDLGVTFFDGNGGLKAIENISFHVDREEFLCVLGPSGCGKSTLLRVLAGLVPPTHGRVVFAPQTGSQRPPCIGLVFQQANLMPWRTVLGNITLPLELENVEPAVARQRAEALIDLVGLQGFEDTWPRGLSGGMAQRVALARALIQNPDLLLLDEPFGSLDALTREQMGAELLRIWQTNSSTVIMVTHSITEALLLSDRALVFSPRPARICLDMQVDLPRPRQEDIRYTPRFGDLARSLREAIG